MQGWEANFVTYFLINSTNSMFVMFLMESLKFHGTVAEIPT